MKALFRLLVTGVVLTLPIAAAHGQGVAADDAAIVARAVLVAENDHIALYRDGIAVDPRLLDLAESARRQLAGMPGVRWDSAVLGPKMRIYVAAATKISHVWNGYRHPRDPRAALFLNRRAYRGAIAGTNATYIHEMVHLFTWNYRSHTLREGLADYLALQVLPGVGVGANPDGHDLTAPVPAEIRRRLGTTEPPGRTLGDPAGRRAYYTASYRFVSYLVDQGGLETFMVLYAAAEPVADIPRLYGITREEALRRAGL